MKKLLIISFGVCLVAFAAIVREVASLANERTIEQFNTRIKYLHDEEGYSWEAAKHISDVENGLVPADAEYNALMED